MGKGTKKKLDKLAKSVETLEAQGKLTHRDVEKVLEGLDAQSKKVHAIETHLDSITVARGGRRRDDLTFFDDDDNYDSGVSSDDNLDAFGHDHTPTRRETRRLYRTLQQLRHELDGNRLRGDSAHLRSLIGNRRTNQHRHRAAEDTAAVHRRLNDAPSAERQRIIDWVAQTTKEVGAVHRDTVGNTNPPKRPFGGTGYYTAKDGIDILAAQFNRLLQQHEHIEARINSLPEKTSEVSGMFGLVRAATAVASATVNAGRYITGAPRDKTEPDRFRKTSVYTAYLQQYSAVIDQFEKRIKPGLKSTHPTLNERDFAVVEKVMTEYGTHADTVTKELDKILGEAKDSYAFNPTLDLLTTCAGEDMPANVKEWRDSGVDFQDRVNKKGKPVIWKDRSVVCNLPDLTDKVKQLAGDGVALAAKWNGSVPKEATKEALKAAGLDGGMGTRVNEIFKNRLRLNGKYEVAAVVGAFVCIGIPTEDEDPAEKSISTPKKAATKTKASTKTKDGAAGTTNRATAMLATLLAAAAIAGTAVWAGASGTTNGPVSSGAAVFGPNSAGTGFGSYTAHWTPPENTSGFRQANGQTTDWAPPVSNISNTAGKTRLYSSLDRKPLTDAEYKAAEAAARAEAAEAAARAAEAEAETEARAAAEAAEAEAEVARTVAAKAAKTKAAKIKVDKAEAAAKAAESKAEAARAAKARVAKAAEEEAATARAAEAEAATAKAAEAEAVAAKAAKAAADVEVAVRAAEVEAAAKAEAEAAVDHDSNNITLASPGAAYSVDKFTWARLKVDYGTALNATSSEDWRITIKGDVMTVRNKASWFEIVTKDKVDKISPSKKGLFSGSLDFTRPLYAKFDKIPDPVPFFTPIDFTGSIRDQIAENQEHLIAVLALLQPDMTNNVTDGLFHVLSGSNETTITNVDGGGPGGGNMSRELTSETQFDWNAGTAQAEVISDVMHFLFFCENLISSSPGAAAAAETLSSVATVSDKVTTLGMMALALYSGATDRAVPPRYVLRTRSGRIYNRQQP